MRICSALQNHQQRCDLLHPSSTHSETHRRKHSSWGGPRNVQLADMTGRWRYFVFLKRVTFPIYELSDLYQDLIVIIVNIVVVVIMIIICCAYFVLQNE